MYMEARRHVGTLCVCPFNGALKHTWLCKKSSNYNINKIFERRMAGLNGRQARERRERDRRERGRGKEERKFIYRNLYTKEES